MFLCCLISETATDCDGLGHGPSAQARGRSRESFDSTQAKLQKPQSFGGNGAAALTPFYFSNPRGCFFF